MARRQVDYTIPPLSDDAIADWGRDVGKTFRITEMPASQGEWWAVRFFFALGRTGFAIPPEVAALGLAGIAQLGLTIVHMFGKIDPFDAKPLIDEMMACVQIVEDKMVRARVEEDIQEIPTRLKLVREVFEHHTGFFSRAARLKSQASAATASST